MARKYLVFRDELERDYLKKIDMTAYASKDSVDELAGLVAPFDLKLTAEYPTESNLGRILNSGCEYLLLAYKSANIKIYAKLSGETKTVGPIAFLSNRSGRWEMKDIFDNTYILTSSGADNYRMEVGGAVVYLIKI